MTQHRYVVVDKPGFLDVGIAYSISSEEHEKDDKKWWYVYHQYHAFMGFDDAIRVDFDKVYLEGTVKGLNQNIKIEIHIEEKLQEIIELYEPVVEGYTKVLLPLLKSKALLELEKELL